MTGIVLNELLVALGSEHHDASFVPSVSINRTCVHACVVPMSEFTTFGLLDTNASL